MSFVTTADGTRIRYGRTGTHQPRLGEDLLSFLKEYHA